MEYMPYVDRPYPVHQSAMQSCGADLGNKCQMEANPLTEFLHTGECLPTDKAN